MIELFLSYPDFKFLEVNVYTQACPESVTQALFAETPQSLGEIDAEKIVLDFGLPLDVDSRSSEDEYGPMIALLIENDGSCARLDLILSRSSEDAHVHVKLMGDQTKILFDGDLQIQGVDADKPYRLV